LLQRVLEAELDIAIPFVDPAHSLVDCMKDILGSGDREEEGDSAQGTYRYVANSDPDLYASRVARIMGLEENALRGELVELR
jgi:hypothetical protein